MHPAFLPISSKLRRLRETRGNSQSEVEAALVVGPGWVGRFESGADEPSLGVLTALLTFYGTTFTEFFSDLNLEGESVTLDRSLSFSTIESVTRLHFRMGPHNASVVLPGVSFDDCRDALSRMKDRLTTLSLTDAVKDSFLELVCLWPQVNPSDLWAFFIQHAYIDPFNHAAGDQRDWPQSWKRTGGWALERVFLDFYNPELQAHGLQLIMPPRDARVVLLDRMGIRSHSAAEKADIVILGKDADGEAVPIGVVHVKASFAERRTDDIPLSLELMNKGHLSLLATMDCKATPSATPHNKGELGEALGVISGSSKRRDIEVEGLFTACFSYNSNTIPTPESARAVSPIKVLNFGDANDAFSQSIRSHWSSHQPN